MPANKRNPNNQHSLIASNQYRTACLALCIACFEKAESEKQFAAMIRTLELAAESLSEYPTLDTMLIQSVGTVLADAGCVMQRWRT